MLQNTHYNEIVVFDNTSCRYLLVSVTPVCCRYSAFSAFSEPCVVYWITKMFFSQEGKASSSDTCRWQYRIKCKERRAEEEGEAHIMLHYKP